MSMPTLYPWQHEAWRHALQRYKANMPHALLLSGCEGIGKQRFAQALAAFQLCSGTTTKPCGQCRDCQLVSAGSHPDLFELYPEKAQIKIDQIRAVVQALEQTANQGRTQVVIIYPAETMNASAANALLKTLEEPVGHVIMILVSHRPLKLLATLRSRCQSFVLKQPNTQQARAWLSAEFKHSQEAYHALMLTDGSPLKALAAKAYDWPTQLDTFLKALAQGTLEPVSLAKEWAHLPLEDIFNLFQRIIVDLSCLHVGADHSTLYFSNYLEWLKRILEHSSSVKLWSLYDSITQAARQLYRVNSLNSTLLLEKLLIEWNAIQESNHVH